MYTQTRSMVIKWFIHIFQDYFVRKKRVFLAKKRNSFFRDMEGNFHLKSDIIRFISSWHDFQRFRKIITCKKKLKEKMSKIVGLWQFSFLYIRVRWLKKKSFLRILNTTLAQVIQNCSYWVKKYDCKVWDPL